MAEKKSLWKLNNVSWLQVLKHTYEKVNADDVFGRSAELAYYFLLALFPLLLFVLSILGFMAAVGSSVRESMFTMLSRVMPSSAGSLVQQTVTGISQGASGLKAVFSLLGALWAASGGVVTLMDVLNIAYSVEERRSFLKKRAIAVGLTVASAVLVILALSIVLYGGMLADFVSSHVGLGHGLVLLWKVAQWPVMFAFIFLTFSLLYYYGPDLKKPQWRWITPGSAVGVIIWIAASLGFKLYLTYFNSYSKIYGSLAGVVILILWIYLTAMSLLLGAEVNRVIEQATDEADKQQQARDRIMREARTGLQAA